MDAAFIEKMERLGVPSQTNFIVRDSEAVVFVASAVGRETMVD